MTSSDTTRQPMDTMKHKNLIQQTKNYYMIYGGSNVCLVSQLRICTRSCEVQDACQGNGPPFHMLSIVVRSQPHHTTNASDQTTEDVWDTASHRQKGVRQRVFCELYRFKSVFSINQSVHFNVVATPNTPAKYISKQVNELVQLDPICTCLRPRIFFRSLDPVWWQASLEQF